MRNGEFYIDYTVYSKRDVLNRGINLKDRERVFTLFFKIGHLSFGVNYKPNYFNGTMGAIAHFDFYALSQGFEKFTSTGYRSCFVHNGENVASYKDIKEYFLEQFKGKVDFLGDKPIQLGLF